MRYYLGVDNGGTATKAALFDMHGREIASASAQTGAVSDRIGFMERDMEDMWRANCDVIRAAIKKSGVAAKDIAGVAVTGHGKGLYLWGKDGRPARRGILSTDNRAWEYPKKWQEDGTEGKAFARSLQHVLACQPVSLLAWLRDHEPETLSNVRWIFSCKDYVRFRLTGEARAEITDYSGANLLNLFTRSYDGELLRLFGIEALRGALPPLCRSDEIAGYVTAASAAETGLLPGTPVAGGMFDIDACAIALGVTDETHICAIAGTWSINEYIRKTPVTDGRVLMNSLFCMGDYYLIEECSPTSAGNNEWFAEALLPELRDKRAQAGESVYDEINAMVSKIAASEFCPVFLPFLMASNVHPNAKACFVGLSSSHTRSHMARGVYEGVAFSHKQHIDRLLFTRAVPPISVRLAGGMARSKVWTQMLADVLGLPVEVVEANEAGALGAAIAAAAAVGDFSSMEEAVFAMCAVRPAVLPDQSRAKIYAAKYAMYKKVIAVLDPVWDDMEKLIQGEAYV